MRPTTRAIVFIGGPTALAAILLAHYLAGSGDLPGWYWPLAAFVFLAGAITWRSLMAPEPQEPAMLPPGRSVRWTRSPAAAASPTSDAELIGILRASKDREELEAARAELDARRRHNRASGIGNDSDGLDFLIGYATGFPVPSGAGLIGMMLHTNAAGASQVDVPRTTGRTDAISDETRSGGDDYSGGGGGGGGSDE